MTATQSLSFLPGLRRKFAATLLAAALSMGTTSCNDSPDGGNAIPDGFASDFVTFVSTDDAGSVFTFRKSGDSPLITLTSTVRVNTDKLKPDTRVIIQYSPSAGQGAYASGPIDLYGIFGITTGGVTVQPIEQINEWTLDALKMYSLVRSGDYLNVWCEAYGSSTPLRFELVADETTLDDDCPALHLVYVSDNRLAYARQYYASFTLTSVWDRPGCKGVTVTYNSPQGPHTVTFPKTPAAAD